jgi:hypothetical protein
VKPTTSQAQLDVLSAAAAEERSRRPAKVSTPSPRDKAAAALDVLKEAKVRVLGRVSLRTWSGGTGKHGGPQFGSVQVLDALSEDRIAALYTAPECGCGSHSATECPDCGALVCVASGHGRHVCAEPGPVCLRCEGSGKVAHDGRGVAWPEWLRRCERDARGVVVAGSLRFPPSQAAVVAVRPTACPRCHGGLTS